MPKSYGSVNEARTALLAASKKWRVELQELRKKQKSDDDKKLAMALDTALDEVASAANHSLTAVAQAEEIVNKMDEGVGKLQELAESHSEDLGTLQDRVAKVEHISAASETKANRADTKANSALTQCQMMQLRDAASGVILRNIPVTTKNAERYEDMEEALEKALQPLRYIPKISQIKRLQKVKTHDKRAPATMKVTLASPGERIKFYNAIEHAVSNEINLPFSVNSEIPQYAISAYKHLGKLASIIRENDGDIKTRVGILRGEVWPTLLVKQRNEARYIKADKTMMAEAKAEVIRRHKERAQAKKAKAPKPTGGQVPMEVDPRYNMRNQGNNTDDLANPFLNLKIKENEKNAPVKPGK